MASFHTKTFTKHDDYMTPDYAWKNIKEYIPKGKVIWEPFFGDGTSGHILTDLGFPVIHNDDDFFESDKGEIIVSNPPFSKKKEVFARLKELGKPFIMICPSAMINTRYIAKLYSDDEEPLQIMIPRRRIQFLKLVTADGGSKSPQETNSCNFDCFYYCWKIGLPRDILWLGE